VEIDGMDRRQVLKKAASLVGGVGTYLAAIPFFASLLPSARARAFAGPIEVDLSQIKPGEVKAYLYRGRTMLVLRRTQAMIAALDSMRERMLDAGKTSDPAYVENEFRSIRPEFLVVEGVCTHLACIPQLKTVAQGQREVGDWWAGGFICPCHVSGYDYAGRVVKGPAPANLAVPPHRYVSPTRLVIGEAAPAT
jgi:ubiquinol-cytochrome c reductase iron-sulfur subunit